MFWDRTTLGYSLLNTAARAGWWNQGLSVCLFKENVKGATYKNPEDVVVVRCRYAKTNRVLAHPQQPLVSWKLNLHWTNEDITDIVCPSAFCVPKALTRSHGRQENNKHRGRYDITFCSRCRDAASSLHSNICFSSSLRNRMLYLAPLRKSLLPIHPVKNFYSQAPALKSTCFLIDFVLHIVLSALQCQGAVNNRFTCERFQLVFCRVFYLFVGLVFDHLFDIQPKRKVRSFVLD